MGLLELDDDSLGIIVSFLSQLDALRLSLSFRRIHPFARQQALSRIVIKSPGQLNRVCRYLLLDVPGRLLFVRSLTVHRSASGQFWLRKRDNLDADPSLLAEVLRQGDQLRSLRLELFSTVHAAEPQVASAICALRPHQHLDLYLDDISNDTIDMLTQTAFIPRQLCLFNCNPADVPDMSALLRAPLLRRVRCLHIHGLRITDDDSASHRGGAPVQCTSVEELWVGRCYVSMATLTTSFPNVKSLLLRTRRPAQALESAGPDFFYDVPCSPPSGDLDLSEWREENYDHGLKGSETACWEQLDTLRCDRGGSVGDLIRWNATTKVRWLILEPGPNPFAWRTLSAVRRMQPVVLSLECLSPPFSRLFWTHLASAAPRIRYLDITLEAEDTAAQPLSTWAVRSMQSLSLFFN